MNRERAVDAVRAAKNPRDALMALARNVDEMYEELSKQAGDLWETWDDDREYEDHEMAAAGALPTKVPSDTAPEFTAVQIPIDLDEIARLEDRLTEQTDRLERSFKGGDPSMTRELAAIVQGLQARLRLAKNPGSMVPVSGDQVGDPEAFFKVDGVDPSLSPRAQEGIEGGPQLVVNLPAATDLQKTARRVLAEKIDLPGFFPAVMRQTEEARAEIINNYVKGGPLWLYLGGAEGRKIIMEMPPQAKAAVLHDVAAYGDVRVAHEFGRDIMKDGDNGITPGDAQDYLLGIVDGRVDDFGMGNQDG